MIKYKKWALEGVWWIGSAMLLILILLPIRSDVINYPFYLTNVLLILITVTLGRWIFFWHLHPFDKSRIFRYFLFVVSIASVIYSMRWLNDFHRYVDETGLTDHLDHLNWGRQKELRKYIVNQMVFFGVGAVLTSILMPIRLIVSNWRQKNKGTS